MLSFKLKSFVVLINILVMFKYGDHNTRMTLGEIDIYVVLKAITQVVTLVLILLSDGVSLLLKFLARRRIFYLLIFYSIVSFTALYSSSGHLNGYYFSFSVIYSILLVSWYSNSFGPRKYWMKNVFKRLYYFIFLSLLLSYVLYPNLTFGPENNYRLQSVSIFVGANGLAWFFLCFSIYLFFENSNNKLLLFILFVLILMTQSRTSIILISLFYFIVSNKKIKFLFLLIVLLNLNFDQFYEIFSRGETQLQNLSGRTLIWEYAISTWNQNKLIGIGLWNGPFQSLNMTYFSGISQLHNSYIEVLVSTGIIGLFFWGLFLVKNLIKSIRNMSRIIKINDFNNPQFIFSNILIILLPIKMITSSEAVYHDHSFILFLLASYEIFKTQKYLTK